MQTLKLTRRGTIKIVSSGYADRYPLSEVWLIIRRDGVEYRIDSENDRVSAYLTLAGMQDTEENVRIACREISSSTVQLSAFYSTDRTSGSIVTTTSRIRAGIAAATGYPSLNDRGASECQTVAATLTKTEWLVIECALQRINERHAKTGKPCVDFVIPREARQ